VLVRTFYIKVAYEALNKKVLYSSPCSFFSSFIKTKAKKEQGELKTLHKQKKTVLSHLAFFSYAFSWVSKKKHAG
jgi:hypothetical protein